MTTSSNILIAGQNGRLLFMDAAMANRHGIISGATGTGKTVTLQVLAEAFSSLGVPVFMADIKGDLSGLGNAGSSNEHITSRVQSIGMENYRNHANPVVFWDLFGRSGHPIRTTISDMGPLLLSSLLELNDTQTGILYSGFKIADDHGLLLLDLKDLRSLLSWMGDNARELKKRLWQYFFGKHRCDTTTAAGSGAAGCGTFLRRTRPAAGRSRQNRFFRKRCHQHSRCHRPGEPVTAPVCDLPALAALGTV